MNFTPFTTPRFISYCFSNYTWKKKTSSKDIYLTFDDGPTPVVTSWVLDTLRAYNAKATFFCIGNNISKYPEVFEQIIDDNHRIANHTYYHEKGWKTLNEDYIESVQKTEKLIENKVPYLKNQKKLFRPPYGQIKDSQGKTLNNMGYEIIMWSLLTQDWKSNLSNAYCLKKTIEGILGGSIVVLHDSLKSEDKLRFLLPEILKYFTKKGYKFKAL